MKKLVYFIALAFLAIACNEDFLYLSPETYLNSGAFFKNERDFKQALVAAYTPLRVFVETNNHMDESRSDNTHFTYGQGGPANWYIDIDVFIDQSQTTYTNNNYYAAYQGISKVNVILTRLEGITMKQTTKDSIMGEALFLRAFYYFELVRHFGGVPLYTTEVTSEDQAFEPRATVEQVYSQIITDLSTAIPILPVAATFPQSGRASKGAAKLLLAYAYMSKPSREYAKAETELRDITGMKYTLLPNYADVFKPTNKNNSESVFEVQFQEGDQGQESKFCYYFMPRTQNTSLVTGIASNNLTIGGCNTPLQELVDSYEKGDLRLPASIGIIEGTGTQESNNFVYTAVKDVSGFTPTPGKAWYYYIKKYVHGPYAKVLNTGENFPIFRYSEALLLLAECLVEQNKNSEALPYLNQVRKRAGLPDLTAATKDNVANERRHELAFENKRWPDLIRTGKAIEAINAKAARIKAIYPLYILPTMFKITQDKLIYPIPYKELVLNPNLVQNPGY